MLNGDTFVLLLAFLSDAKMKHFHPPCSERWAFEAEEMIEALPWRLNFLDTPCEQVLFPLKGKLPHVWPQRALLVPCLVPSARSSLERTRSDQGVPRNLMTVSSLPCLLYRLKA